jgi:hypothetical protein
MVERYAQLPFQDELGMFGGLTIYLRQKAAVVATATAPAATVVVGGRGREV